MQARELMTQHVHTCSSEDTLEHAARLMWEHDVGCIVVVDAERRPVAMITDRDVAMAAYTRGARLSEANVASAMSKQIVYCSPEATVSDVEHLMQAALVRRVPVANASGKLVGIVTLGDLTRATLGNPLLLPAVPEVARTLATVSSPRSAEASPRAA